ncbi:hypothetical protein SB87_gp119 [Parapoxvirus red deer/HL953]|uniref:NF-kappa pathway inhibitor n=1 Tax=Parapoxvirus red deer/HL953 TaxID=1579460 RepID=A0A0A7MC78_9POXV|nr:hypothetical protein SB87_gp119 [Parapoxvirus red deer/HL953]AIZ77372.1 hypothetical protein [Parapoxvirus red deer/HL953]
MASLMQAVRCFCSDLCKSLTSDHGRSRSSLHRRRANSVDDRHRRGRRGHGEKRATASSLNREGEAAGNSHHGQRYQCRASGDPSSREGHQQQPLLLAPPRTHRVSASADRARRKGDYERAGDYCRDSAGRHGRRDYERTGDHCRNAGEDRRPRDRHSGNYARTGDHCMDIAQGRESRVRFEQCGDETHTDSPNMYETPDPVYDMPEGGCGACGGAPGPGLEACRALQPLSRRRRPSSVYSGSSTASSCATGSRGRHNLQDDMQTLCSDIESHLLSLEKSLESELNFYKTYIADARSLLLTRAASISNRALCDGYGNLADDDSDEEEPRAVE